MKPFLYFTTIFIAGLLWVFTCMPSHAANRDTKWRYRATVTVATPEGIKTGSAVREVIFAGYRHGGGGTTIDIRCKGQAVAVDLGKRGVLFMLTGGDNCGDEFLYAFTGELAPEKVPERGIARPRLNVYYSFVRFRDLKNPKTVESVARVKHCRRELVGGACSEIETGPFRYPGKNPFIDKNDFEKSFGEGVTLKDVVFELTNDSTTSDLDNILPWLSCGGDLYPGATHQLRLENHKELYAHLRADEFTLRTPLRHEGATSLCASLVQENKIEMFQWLLKQAEEGSARRQHELADAYMRGEGVAENKTEGFKWYLKSAAQGNEGAQRKLAKMYRDGDGIQQDYTEALFWTLVLRKQGGLPVAIIKELRDFQYTAHMTSEEINTSMKRAKEWLPMPSKL